MSRTVLIVDDHAGFRSFARAILQSDGFTVVGEAVDGATALAATAELHPDVVLLDVQLAQDGRSARPEHLRQAGAGACRRRPPAGAGRPDLPEGVTAVEEAGVRTWLEGYVAAWATNEPEDIARLFAVDGRYFTAPYREPWVGHEAIVEGWRGIGDQPGTWEFVYEVTAVAGDLAFVRGHTTYLEPPAAYENLWVIRFDADGRCTEFTEWFMEAPARPG